MTSSYMYGVGEIISDKNIAHHIYPLPADFPEKKCDPYDDRSFSFQTASGNDLIYSVQEPGSKRNSSHSHYIFCFGTDSKQWSRIESVEKDGTYIRKPVLSETVNNRFLSNPDLRRIYLSGPDQCLYIWSICPGKIRVEKAASVLYSESGESEDSARSYCIKEQAEAVKNFMINNFHDYLGIIEPLKLPKDFKSGIFFHIRGIKKFLTDQILTSEEKKDIEKILFCETGAVKFRYNERDVLGIFINYCIPRGWEKSCFLLFRHE